MIERQKRGNEGLHSLPGENTFMCVTPGTFFAPISCQYSFAARDETGAWMRHKAYAIGTILIAVIGSLVLLREELATLTDNVGVANHGVAIAPVESVQLAKPGRAPSSAAQPNSAQPRSAAATIRSTQVTQTQRAQETSGNIAASAAPKRDETPPQKKETASSASADSQAPPKSAEELLSAFVTDDPTQVFLPESVRIHAAVQSEPVDPDWGPAASQAMRDYLLAQFGDRFEIPVADCRQDLCELEVASRLSGNSDADMRDFQEALFLMKKQPWWSALQFDQETGLVGTSPDGRALFVYFFSRK
jgi:hypothetical protein